MEPFTKIPVKIRFGIVKAKQPKKKKKKKDKAAKKGKKDKNAKSEPEEIKLEPAIVIPPPPVIDKTLKYVAKYNIMLGSIELIRDFVIIGEFK